MGAPKLLLAIDTCTRRASIALRDAHVLLAERAWEADRHHSAAVAQHILNLCAECGVPVADIDAVAVALGPGSFTGVRCGLAIAKGMAVANAVQLAAFSAFEILLAGQSHTPTEERPLFALVAAGRKRVAICRYPRPPAGTASFEVVANEDVSSRVGAGAEVCGDVPDGLQFVAGVTVAPPARNLRRAGVLADLGWQQLTAGLPVAAAALAPIYPPSAGS